MINCLEEAINEAVSSNQSFAVLPLMPMAMDHGFGWVSFKVGGHEARTSRHVDNFAYVRINGAYVFDSYLALRSLSTSAARGHQVGAYGGDNIERSQAALQFYNQTIHGQPPPST